MNANSGATNGQAPSSNKTERIGDDQDEWDAKSVTKSYYRMKASEARKYIEGLRIANSRVELEKLEDDERRILKSRARLSKNEKTQHLKKEVESSFKKWVKGKKSELQDEKRKDLVKPKILNNREVEVGVDDDPAHEVKAYFMFFEKDEDEWKGKTYRGLGFPEYENFPNQRISIHDALYHQTDNPFKVTHDSNGNRYLRYIHIPANHMGWIEQAMARYHDEHSDPVEQRVKTNRTLSRQFWKGQLHGSGLGRNPIHATHMRPRCSVIPGDQETQSLFVEQKPQPKIPHSHETARELKDLAIFMPYLHWETYHRTARMATVVQDVLRKELKTNQMKRRTTRLANKDMDLDKYTEIWQDRKTETDDKPRFKPNALGKYLLSLAQLWQAMDIELDETMVRHGLVPRDAKDKLMEPSLHIRRTLDQSYFLNLNDTSQRDKDQVVYRATQGRGNGDLARVVMVDQLWLWILDEHTIITSFPKRWGRNKPDPSGIHKSLRDRLAEPDQKILSAWHLAFMIIDQCSNVFFDRTKPLDLRPEVMDIFAETLGDVNHYTAITFSMFWRNVERFSNSRNKRYLNINPEGTLLREAQDIAEESRIMAGIFSQQLCVVKSFQKYLEHVNGDRKMQKKPVQFTDLLHIFPGLADWAKEHGTSHEPRQKPVSSAEMDYLEDLVEEVDNRKSEIMDLESAAMKTCQQLQELLTLKQQQISIVEAEAALHRAEESIQQGKAIMAFTIMTIIFAPLGFFTSFFGMNNSLTGADWMTLGNQCLYMTLISATIISIALSLAFKDQIRHSISKFRQPKKLRTKTCEKATEKGEKSQPNESNGARALNNGDGGKSSGFARAYFQLQKAASRNKHLRNDEENSLPTQDRISVRSKTMD